MDIDVQDILENDGAMETLGAAVEATVREYVKAAVFAGTKKGIQDALNALSDQGLLPKNSKPKAKAKSKPKGKKESGKSNGKIRARKAKRDTTNKEPLELPSLTDTQENVMQFIQDYREENGKSPTYTEIADGLGKSGVASIVHAIANKGHINLNDKKSSRKIEVVKAV